MEADSVEHSHEVFNVGGGRAVTVAEFARIMLDAGGSELELDVSGVFRVGDICYTVSDISRMRALGWELEVFVEQNVCEYLEWLETFWDIEQYLVEVERIMCEQ